MALTSLTWAFPTAYIGPGDPSNFSWGPLVWLGLCCLCAGLLFPFLNRPGIHLVRSPVSFYLCLHIPACTKWTLYLVCSFALSGADDVHVSQPLVLPTAVSHYGTATAHEGTVWTGVPLSSWLVPLIGQFGCSLTLIHKWFIPAVQSECISLSELHCWLI